MAIEMKRLLNRAFFVEEPIQNATDAINRARQKYFDLTRNGAFSVDVVLPENADEAWLRERLLRPLVYFCESEGMPVPKCPGVFVSMFVGAKLHCIAAADLFEWAREELGANPADLVRDYGTHEIDSAMR